MLTLKQIATLLGITVARARLCLKESRITPVQFVGRTGLYADEVAGKIEYYHSHVLQTRKRRKTNAESTADAQSRLPKAEANQGNEATLPPICPMESDPPPVPSGQPAV